MDHRQQRSTAGGFDEKADVYAEFGNGTVEALAQRALASGGRVLDVGCASGGLLARLGSATFRAGIEPAAAAVAQARSVADEIHHGGVADDLPWAPASFDVVVLADVLEHLPDPDAALARAVELVRPGGLVIVSVPSVTHWQARVTIARGRFPREESGTFDATHLQWFTADRLLAMVAAAGLEAPDLMPVVPRLRNHLSRLGRLAPLESAWQALGRRRPALLGYQLVVAARRPGPSAHPHP